MKNKTPLKKFIEGELEKQYNAPPEYEAKPNMRPSFLGTPCLRKIYYNFLRVPRDYGWKGEKIRNFEKGDALHNMVKRWLRASGLLIDYRNKGNGEIPKHWKTGEPDPEFPVNDQELNIKNAKIDGVGFVDGIEGIEPGLWVFEIKSINEKGFYEYIQKGPKGEHLEQAMIYAFLLEQGLKEGKYAHIEELEGCTEVKGVIYIYINRENDEDDWKEFVISKREEPFMNIVQKIVETKEYIANNELPPKTEDFCKWCDYRDKCAKNYKVSK